MSGEGGIRTLERFYTLHDFQSCALDQAQKPFISQRKIVRLSRVGNTITSYREWVTQLYYIGLFIHSQQSQTGLTEQIMSPFFKSRPHSIYRKSCPRIYSVDLRSTVCLERKPHPVYSDFSTEICSISALSNCPSNYTTTTNQPAFL